MIQTAAYLSFVENLIRRWREESDRLEADTSTRCDIRYGRTEQLRDCADELEALAFHDGIAEESRNR